MTADHWAAVSTPQVPSEAVTSTTRAVSLEAKMTLVVLVVYLLVIFS